MNLRYKRNNKEYGLQERYVTPEDKRKLVAQTKKIGLEAVAEANNVNVDALRGWVSGKCLVKGCTTAYVPKELRHEYNKRNAELQNKAIYKQENLFEKKETNCSGFLLKIKPSLKIKINEYAQEKGISSSEAVRRILEGFLSII